MAHQQLLDLREFLSVESQGLEVCHSRKWQIAGVFKIHMVQTEGECGARSN